MKASIRLDIEKPCSQKWTSLEKTGTGRYCASCDFQVIDFTTWPEDKILAFLSQAKGKVCGRLLPEQCRTEPAFSRKKKSLLRSPLLLVASVLSLASTDSLWARHKAVTGIFQTGSAKNDQGDQEAVAASTPAKTTFTIQGLLVDKDNAEPVPGATVLWVGTRLGTTTDRNGRFTLQLTGHQQEQVNLSFAFIGYETGYQIVPLEKEMTDLGTITLAASTQLLGEVVILRNNPTSIWQRLLHPFKSK